MKTNRLFVIIALVLMLTGVSYAYWQQTVELNTTINSGKLSLDVSCGAPTSANYVKVTAELSADQSNLVDLSIAGMYPKSYAILPLTVENSGTLGVILKDFAIKPVWPVDDADYSAEKKAKYQALNDHIDIYIKAVDDTEQQLSIGRNALTDSAIKGLGYQTAAQFVAQQVSADYLIDVKNGEGASSRQYALLFVFDKEGDLELGELANMQMHYSLVLDYQQFNALNFNQD